MSQNNFWQYTYRNDPRARILADKHYSRKSKGSKHFTPPGRCIVMVDVAANALWASAVWISSWPYAHLVKRAYPEAYLCAMFRNESSFRSSDLINDAVEMSIERWGPVSDDGFITFVDTKKVVSEIPGYCFRRAKWKHVGETKSGLLIFQWKPRKIYGGTCSTISAIHRA